MATNPDEFIPQVAEYVLNYLIAAESPVLSFMQGSPHGGADLTTNTTAQANFRLFFGNWIGQVLQCDQSTWTNANHPTGRSLAEVHAPMHITDQDWDNFKATIYLGFWAWFRVEETVDPLMAIVEGTKSQIVFPKIPPSAPILTTACDILSNQESLTPTAWMNAQATEVINNVTSVNNPFAKYFNGSIANTTDYTHNATLRANLALRYAAFIGRLSGTNCTDMTGDKITRETLRALHQPLKISNATFESYKTTFVNHFRAAGASLQDANILEAELLSYRPEIVYNNTQIHSSAINLVLSSLPMVICFLLYMFGLL
jgi:hypothetical protein